MGSKTTGTKATDRISETDSKASEEIEAVRQSRRATPGAFHVVPSHHNTDGNSSEQSGNDTDGDEEQGQQVDSSGPSSLVTANVQELTEAWVVKDGSSTGSNTAEPVAATPLEEKRRWFRTSGGIFLIVLVAGMVAVAIVLSNRQKDTGPTRPFDLVVPTMPQEVSDVLELKYAKLTNGSPIAMAFTADLTVHASTLENSSYGKLQICKYDASTSSWEIVAELQEEHQSDAGVVPGDSFGSWADMSYDGNIMAVGLNYDDSMGIVDSGSVLIIDLASEDGAESNENSEHVKLEGRSNYIEGDEQFGWTGTTFSLTADGSMIAVSSPIAFTGRGHIRVYKFEKDDSIISGGTWIQIGQDINGDEFGSALSMVKLTEDGTTLAAGSWRYGENQGQMKFFQWDARTNLWVQKGSNIIGDEMARLGVFPQFARDGHIVSFSEMGDLHKCRVYHWEETAQDWTSMDKGLPDSYMCMDLSPDGNKLILCSHTLQDCSLQKFDGEEWVEVQSFPEEGGFLPYLFERAGTGEQIAGIVKEGNRYTIGFYNILPSV